MSKLEQNDLAFPKIYAFRNSKKVLGNSKITVKSTDNI